MGWLIRQPDAHDNFVVGRDLDIVARGRPDNNGRVFGVRWQYRPDYGFPQRGFRVLRRHQDGRPDVLIADDIRLPGALGMLDRSDVLRDAFDRAPGKDPHAGPYFPIPSGDLDQPTFNELTDLIPALALAGPYFDKVAKLSHLPAFSAMVGDSYGADLVLAHRYWPDRRPSPIEEIIFEGSASPGSHGEKRLDDTLKFCEAEATRLLLALSVRFEFAKFLGLGTEDILDEGILDQTKVCYVVSVNEEGSQKPIVASTEWLDLAAIDRPPGPINGDVSVATLPVLLHPSLKEFDPRYGNPARAWPKSPVSEPWSPGDHYPRVPADAVSLFWSPPPDLFDASSLELDRLLTLNPVLYQVSRFDGDHPVAEVLRGAERISLAKTDSERKVPGWVDAGDLVSPIPRSATYLIHGVDLLGILSDPVEVHPQLGRTPPPAPPSIKIIQPDVLSIQKSSNQTVIDLELVWDSTHDFLGPDAEGLSISTIWSPRGSKSVVVTSSISAPGTLASVQSDCVLADIESGIALTYEEGRRFAGGKLLTARGEFLILPQRPEGNATVRLRKNANGPPPVGDAAAIFTLSEIVGPDLDFVSRPQSGEQNPLRIVCTAHLDSLVENMIDLRPLIGALTDESYYIYLHALGRTGMAARNSHGTWSIRDETSDVFSDLRTLGDDAEDFLDGSPALLYPVHRKITSIDAPDGFWAGQLQIRGSPLEVSPAKKSGYSELSREISRRDDLEPPRVKKIGTLWASPAAQHEPDAMFTLKWPAVPMAARYEVDRILTTSLGEEGKRLSDRDFLVAAADPQNSSRYERRSTHAFANRHIDYLPGSSPVRAAFRVRSVSLANVPGDWSEPIGPVRTPDIRRPARPTLLSAKPTSGADGLGRTVRLEWTQAGIAQRSGNLDKSADGEPSGLTFTIEILNGEDQSPAWSVYSENVSLRPVFENRFIFDVQHLSPGKKLSFRVLAVRVAYDTISPYLDVTTPVVSEPSAAVSTSAIGDLIPPKSLRVTQTGATINVSWVNAEEYKSLVLRAKSRLWSRTVELKSNQGALSYDGSDFESGLVVSFQLIASGYGRSATSGVQTITAI